MKKTVNYKGKSVQVNFKDFLISKHSKNDSKGYSLENSGEKEFKINDKFYTVKFISIRNDKTGKFNASYYFEGNKFPDNYKLIIEHIVNKYGL
jgi:hypothetical protein